MGEGEDVVGDAGGRGEGRGGAHHPQAPVQGQQQQQDHKVLSIEVVELSHFCQGGQKIPGYNNMCNIYSMSSVV